jgi:hypothetical protein
LGGAHDGPHPAHPSKLFLDQLVTGVDAVVHLRALIVEATRPSFELAADEAEPQPVADAVAQFRIERQESHAAASFHGALPKPPNVVICSFGRDILWVDGQFRTSSTGC